MALKEVSAEFMRSLYLRVNTGEHISIHRFVELMEKVFKLYPTLVPDRFDPFDPLRTKYTKESFRNVINDDDAERHLMWRGKKLAHALHRMAYPDSEDSWLFEYDCHTIPKSTIFSVSDLITKMPITIATLHTISIPEMHYCKSLGLGLERIDGYSFSGFYKNQRVFGLPSLAWRTYFGLMYIRHFGKERLLSAPAWSVREVHPDVICVQLTESIDSVGAEWLRFHDVRQRVIAHLGAESFQRPRTSPDDPPPLHEHDRMGVPGTSIPPELIPLRRQIEADLEKQRRPKPPAIENLEEMLADPKRFRVWEIKASKGKVDRSIVDTVREEMIGFADSTMRDEWVGKLIAAGAELKRV